MTIQTRYNAWGGGATSGELIVPGNDGGGYGRSCASFFKLTEAIGGAPEGLRDAVTNVETGYASLQSYNPAVAAMEGSAIAGQMSFATPGITSTEDYVFFGCIGLLATTEKFYYGDTGVGDGVRLNSAGARHFIGGTTYHTGWPTYNAPVDNTMFCVVTRFDNSAGVLDAYWTDGTGVLGTYDEAQTTSIPAASAWNPTDHIQCALARTHSFGMIITPEARTPSWDTCKDAADWMAVQHNSAAIIAEPTLRSLYPGLIL